MTSQGNAQTKERIFINQEWFNSLDQSDAENLWNQASLNSNSSLTTVGNRNNGPDVDMSVVNYTNSGTFNWSYYYDNGGDDYGVQAQADAAGNVYVVGFTSHHKSNGFSGYQNQ